MDFEAIPDGVPLDSDSLASVERQVDETTAAFSKYVTDIQQGVNSFEQRLLADMEAKLARTAAGDDRKVAREVHQRDIRRQVAQKRREVVEASQDQRTAMLGQLEAARAKLDAVASLSQSPQQMLARLGTGDPKKATYLQTLSLAGPAALVTHAELAVATGDRVLASAVLSVNDSLPSDKRPFSSAELAARLLGAEHEDIQRRVASLGSRIGAARTLDTEFARGGANPTDRTWAGGAAGSGLTVSPPAPARSPQGPLAGNPPPLERAQAASLRGTNNGKS